MLRLRAAPVLSPRCWCRCVAGCHYTRVQELVEHAAASVRQMITSRGEAKAPRILDVGCGSGAIIIALLQTFPQTVGVAVDVSEDAVALTRENAARQGVDDRLAVHLGTVHDVLRNAWRPPRNPNGFSGVTGEPPGLEAALFDVVVSNPPYIPSRCIATLAPDVRDHEDHRALDGGVDGLDVVRQLLHACAGVGCDGIGEPSDARVQLLPRGGSMWLEVDSSHPQQLPDVVAADDRLSARLRVAEWHCDLGNHPRFVRVEVCH